MEIAPIKKVKGRVYTITGDAPDGKTYVYIGSTGTSLKQRLASHRDKFRKYQNKQCSFRGSFTVLALNKYEIELEEELEFDNLDQLLQAERKAYDKYTADKEHYIVTNVNVPARTAKEYYESEEGKESIRRYKQSDKGKEAVKRAQKKYYEKMKANNTLHERTKKYQTSEKGKEAITKANKKYYEKTKEERRAKARELYRAKKAKALENAQEKDNQPPTPDDGEAK